MQFPKPKIYRSKKYLEWLKTQPCIICGKHDTVGHHIRKTKWGSGTGVKGHDFCSLPLCGQCHSSEHASGILKKLVDIEDSIIQHLMKFIHEKLGG